MNLLLQAISWASAKAAGGLLSAIWEGAVLALCVALGLRLTKRLSAAARSAVWMIVFLLLMLLNLLPPSAISGSAGSALRASPLHLDPLWSVAIASLWAMLSLWRGAQLTWSAILLHRLAARATRLHPGAALQGLLEAGTGGRAAELCSSTEVERPSVFGFFNPRILLPPALLDRLTPFELEQVVRHEMEHLRRADDWSNLLQKAALVLFPLNPVLFWVERRLCAERELACDDRVLSSRCGRKTYAACLTRLAEYSIARRGVSLALGAWERQSELAHRVRRILRGTGEPLSGKQSVVLTGCLMAAVLAGAVALAHSPRLVSFDPLPQLNLQAHSIPRPALGERSSPEFACAPELVKASLPERPQKQLVPAHHSNHRRSAEAKTNAMEPETLPDRAAWIVLTEWEEAGPPPQVVLAVARDHRSSYAAIAIANGWLIVQI